MIFITVETGALEAYCNRAVPIFVAFAYAGALIAAPKLLVLDRPLPAYAERILTAAGPRAIFSTHTSGGGAQRFTDRPRTTLVGVVPT